MSDRTTTPTNKVDVPYTTIRNEQISTEQLRRAWCLMLTRSLWPTITALSALDIAKWLYSGSTTSP